MLANELIPLIVGFTLTTVLGGWLGARLQRRTWDHQNEVQLRQDELRRADYVCRSVSKLLDKRLYRMRRFYSALTSDPELPERGGRIQVRLKEYDAVLYEWNDSANLNLALMGAYFGERARNWLDFRLYQQFKQIGVKLADYYQRSIQGSEGPWPPCPRRRHCGVDVRCAGAGAGARRLMRSPGRRVRAGSGNWWAWPRRTATGMLADGQATLPSWAPAAGEASATVSSITW